jgi:long-chain acyl-CoA synthetase
MWLTKRPHLPTSLMVEQIFVYGDSLQHKLVAIVVPDADSALQWSGGIKPSQKLKRDGDGGLLPADAAAFAAVCKDAKFKADLLADMELCAKKASLNSFEKVRDVTLECIPFSNENGLLTATAKSKRPDLIKRYRAEVDALYA